MIVTLLTDFGTADGFAAAMKGVILARAPNATVVDATHEVPPQDVRAGAFALLNFYAHFPAGTVHLAVVDPGVGSSRRAIAVEAGDYWFVGPDNGLFTAVYQRERVARVIHLQSDHHFRRPVSATFHGRDIFAPVAAALAGGVDPETLGPAIADPVRLHWPQAERVGDHVRGAVVHVDRFGNLVTNLSRDDTGLNAFPSGFRLTVAGQEVRELRTFFADGPVNEPFAIWGSAGLLEIAVNGGSAARLLRAGRGSEVLLETA